MTREQLETERHSFILANSHLDMTEDLDSWYRPRFKFSHVEAMWIGWKARAEIELLRSQLTGSTAPSPE